uniref:Uncharacterized protein n=1 Tax=Anguilla anguilla TaxID=7936 RepID=A0A0E9WUJ7_ANGAN
MDAGVHTKFRAHCHLVAIIRIIMRPKFSIEIQAFTLVLFTWSQVQIQKLLNLLNFLKPDGNLSCIFQKTESSGLSRHTLGDFKPSEHA